MDSPKINNSDDLLCLAEALENAAAERFRILAENMRTRGRRDLAALFDSLAREEEDHQAAVHTRSGMKSAADILSRGWPAGLGEAPEVPDPDRIARLTPYDCLADAVRNEQKAFSFFNYLAGKAHAPDLKRLAKELAAQELEHAALLRKARRRAYREALRAREPWPASKSIESRPALEAAADGGENALFQLLNSAAQKVPALAIPSMELREQATALGLEIANHVHAEDVIPRSADLYRALLQGAEAAFDFYDSVATAARDEATVLRARELAQFSQKRLTALRAAFR